MKIFSDKDPITSILEVQSFADRSEIHKSYRDGEFSLVKGCGYSLVCNRHQYELDSLFFITVGTFAHWSIGKQLTPPDLSREAKAFFTSIKSLVSMSELIYQKQKLPMEQRQRMLVVAKARGESRNILKLETEIADYKEQISQSIEVFKKTQQDAYFESLAIDMDEIKTFWEQTILQHKAVVKVEIPQVQASLERNADTLCTTYRLGETVVEKNRYLFDHAEWPVQYPDLTLVTQFGILDESYDPRQLYPPTTYTL